MEDSAPLTHAAEADEMRQSSSAAQWHKNCVSL